MAALVHAASRRFLRLRAYGSSTNTGTISQDAVNLRVWQCSHVEAQEAPGVSRRATVSRNSLLKCKFSYSSQMADTCYPQGLAFCEFTSMAVLTRGGTRSARRVETCNGLAKLPFEM